MNTYSGGFGASGAIAGLASAAMLISPLSITWLAMGIPLPVMVVSWLFLITDLSGVLNPTPGDNIGHFAHLGGFFSITVILWLLGKEHKEKMLKGFLINVGTLAVLAAVWFFL